MSPNLWLYLIGSVWVTQECVISLLIRDNNGGTGLFFLVSPLERMKVSMCASLRASLPSASG